MSRGLAVKIGAARAVGELARRAGRGGGTSLPGKVLIRLEPDAITELAARLPQGSVMLSATNGKTTTAALTAPRFSIATESSVVHNRAGANMAGGVASTLLAAPRAAAGGIDGELGLFEVDEFWLDRLAPRPCARGRCCWPTCSATSSTATASSRRSPTGGRRSWPASRPGTGLILGADDPLVADLGRDRADTTYFGDGGRGGRPAGAPARRRLQALPQLRGAVRLRRGVPRPPRPLPLRAVRPAPPGAAGQRRGDRAARHARSTFTLARRRARGRSSCRCPASTTSTTRSRPPR